MEDPIFQLQTKALPGYPSPWEPPTLTATLGNDSALLVHSPYGWDEPGWTAGSTVDSLRWFVFDDRQMYQPGEEVHIKGWLRRIGGGQTGDVSLVGSDISSVSYAVTDPQGNKIGDGTTNVNALGGFDFVFTLPELVNLGYAQISLSAQGNLAGLNGATDYHRFQIQEFRRPEFEVMPKMKPVDPISQEAVRWSRYLPDIMLADRYPTPM